MPNVVEWQDVTIVFNGKTITGSYASSDWMITLKAQIGSKSMSLDGSDPISLAENMLLELAQAFHV